LGRRTGRRKGGRGAVVVVVGDVDAWFDVTAEDDRADQRYRGSWSWCRTRCGRDHGRKEVRASGLVGTHPTVVEALQLVLNAGDPSSCRGDEHEGRMISVVMGPAINDR